ncbi:MAG: uracil-DNA glycosylase [Endomicrobium sp.]|jgi:DNA polymerase|uniref:uracil-DNA glycosylase n=1 Tax=Candidatus Endomicrobiellum cubanum TaxID=3242325 RepID=UPI00282166F5|nr:uracil-DNA glycosylase [Endomicrobium sp.]MDR2395909.1 uracil-DNA glycosylase [Endomicrobium sp.]
MKQSEYLKILNLAKSTLEDYDNWGETEIYKTSQKPSNKTIPEKQQKIFTKKPLTSKEQLESLRKQVDNCKECSLGTTRLKAVFGHGFANADLMFIGEGPGYDEDHKGEPFIGRAGQLLTKIIEAMGKTRDTVYIANIVKCHPMIDPSNPEKRENDRPPTPLEMQVCKKYLDMQINIIQPKIIVTLGASSTKGLLNREEPISRIRGTIQEYNGVKLVPTYHPSALLRNSSLKKFVWEDMKKVMHFLNTGEI